MVLICYLRQSGGGPDVDFVRRLDIDRGKRMVAIADDLGQGFQPLPNTALLVRTDRATVVFDYASAFTTGRATVNWRTGAYAYSDTQVTVRGSCSPFRR